MLKFEFKDYFVSKIQEFLLLFSKTDRFEAVTIVLTSSLSIESLWSSLWECCML